MEYRTKEELLERAKAVLGKNLGDIIPPGELEKVRADIAMYAGRRKGLFGELVEQFVFNLATNNRSEADFNIAGVELKTNPIKRHSLKTYASKERLVFSMIDYRAIVHETWETSSFLKKNRLLLLMFYLWLEEARLLERKFKFVRLLDIIDDLPSEDVLQIRKDWEFIVNKIRGGQAHLLSEADTYYLGACTKSSNSKVVRDQGDGAPKAKLRAFSLKQQYLDYFIQKDLLGKDVNTESIFSKVRAVSGLEEVFRSKFDPFIGQTDTEIKLSLGWDGSEAKHYKRLLVNRILGVRSNSIEELEKANVTLRVITLEHTGTLRESISFPAFDYRILANEEWLDEANETMADFHLALETKKFLFVVFQKRKDSKEIILRKAQFWNFPMKDLSEAERVFEAAKKCVRDGRYVDLPKITDSAVAHVRPHGDDGKDLVPTPQGTMEARKSFWLNAKYVQKALGY